MPAAMRAARSGCRFCRSAPRWRSTRLSLFGLFDHWRFPVSDARRVGPFTRTPFANLGLHGSGVVENSRAAVEAAVGQGHGVKIDVQFSLDGMAYVFSDPTLDRMTAESGQMRHWSGRELSQVRLNGSEETIPKLDEIRSEERCV